MKKRRQGISKRRAIQNTLSRLGMQASNKKVVAALEKFGIAVAESLVQQVRIEMQRKVAKSESQRLRVPDTSKRFQRPPKMPPRRSNGR